MSGERVVISESLHKRILKEFHTGDPIIIRRKSPIYRYVYRPNMDKDRETCKVCAMVENHH